MSVVPKSAVLAIVLSVVVGVALGMTAGGLLLEAKGLVGDVCASEHRPNP